MCFEIEEPVTPTEPAASGPDLQAIVRQAMARLPIPAPDTQVGPDPSLNQWGIMAVGWPYWFWSDAPDKVATTVTQDGITITITAARAWTDYDFGNGDTMRCTSHTPWAKVDGKRPSPDCGYTYTQMNPIPNVGYTLTATSRWNVTWSGLGQTGTLVVTRSEKRHMPVAEVHSLIVSTNSTPR